MRDRNWCGRAKADHCKLCGARTIVVEGRCTPCTETLAAHPGLPLKVALAAALLGEDPVADRVHVEAASRELTTRQEYAERLLADAAVKRVVPDMDDARLASQLRAKYTQDTEKAVQRAQNHLNKTVERWAHINASVVREAFDLSKWGPACDGPLGACSLCGRERSRTWTVLSAGHRACSICWAAPGVDYARGGYGEPSRLDYVVADMLSVDVEVGLAQKLGVPAWSTTGEKPSMVRFSHLTADEKAILRRWAADRNSPPAPLLARR